MENIILTNNKDLRLVSVKVGVYSTLRFELPLVPESATHVEVIVTSGDVHSAYTATFIPATKFWQCDIAASQFPAVGKQSYEVAYVLDGKQFWDGKGWIEIEDATTSGIEPQPRPEPYRYAVVSVNGYGADAQGAVRIPMTFIATDSPATTEGYIEGDIYFNRETGATWTLCNVQSTLTWVFNYKNYYTKAETEEAIDKLAAYYITYNAAGAAFPTRANLLNAQTYYSGGVARTPTRNDYAVVLADEAHGGAEWRYIYAVADGSTTGQWEAQYPIETNDYDALANKPSINGVTLSGNKTAAALGLATKADATLTDASEWRILHTPLTAEQKAAFYAESPFAASDDYKVTIDEFSGEWHLYVGGYIAAIVVISEDGLKATFDSSQSQEATTIWGPNGTIVATRTALQGYQLGSQADKPIASEAEAEALRTGKQNALTAQQLANIAAVPNKLDKSGGTVTGNLTINKVDPTIHVMDGPRYLGLKIVNNNKYIETEDYDFQLPRDDGTLALTAGTGHAGNLAALDANGNPTDAGWTAGNLARYALTTKTISDGAVTLDDRAMNAVAVSSALASLTINFPTATSGKVRDFGLRLSVASGVTTAPELVLPQGVTCENADGEVPEIGADGAATILYFTETASGVFLVKGEVVTAIS